MRVSDTAVHPCSSAGHKAGETSNYLHAVAGTTAVQTECIPSCGFTHLSHPSTCAAEHYGEEDTAGFPVPEHQARPPSKYSEPERHLDKGETLVAPQQRPHAIYILYCLTVRAQSLPIVTVINVLIFCPSAGTSGESIISIPGFSSCSAKTVCAVQDKGASDSMEPAMNLMQLNGIIRKAINLVTGAQLHVDETIFELAVTSVIPGFKVLRLK